MLDTKMCLGYAVAGVGGTMLARISYTIVDSPLDRLLVAGTERGVCAIALGSRSAELVDALFRRYARAEVERDDAALTARVRRVLAALRGEDGLHDLPLDVEGTPFQQQVWRALRAISRGKTATYADVARAIGRPRAARAVARACAENPVAIAVPCHRVIRSDGDLGGYRWGIERKRWLLAAEGALPAGGAVASRQGVIAPAGHG